MSDTETHKEAHRGVIRIVTELVTELVPEITIDHCDTQGRLREKGLFSKLHEKLLLPESYTIQAMFIEHYGRAWDIVVESPELPEAQEGEEYPTIEPRYVATLDDSMCKVVSLVAMVVTQKHMLPVKGGNEAFLRAL